MDVQVFNESETRSRLDAYWSGFAEMGIVPKADKNTEDEQDEKD